MIKSILGFLVVLILFSSCSSTRIAKRKYRKAEKLMREAGMLDPNLADTVYIVEIDTVFLTKDSLVFQTELQIDTIRIDNIIEKLILVRQQGGDIDSLKKELYNELLPDLHHNSRDSLKIIIDEKEHFVRFEINLTITEGSLIATVKAVDNVPFISTTQEININATKIRGGFWRVLQWGFGLSLLLFIIGWFLRGIIGTAIKKVIS